MGRIFSPQKAIMQNAEGTVLQANTQIEFRGHQISVAMDDSHLRGDLIRTEIRVFRGEDDVTGEFEPDPKFLSTSEDLFHVMQAIVDRNPES